MKKTVMPVANQQTPVLFRAIVASIGICVAETAMAAASETLVWQPDSGGVISAAENWKPAQTPAATSEVDVTKAQSAPITLSDDFHVYSTKLSANSSGAEMVIDMCGHEYLNEGSIETYNNTVYVFTNGTLKIATNSERHPNLVKNGSTLAFRGTETIYFESNLTATAQGAMEVDGGTLDAPSVLEVANGAKFYRYVGNTQSLRIKMANRITVANGSEMVVVADAASKAALQTGYGNGSSNSRFELLDRSKLDFFGTVVCGATLSTTNGLFLVDGGSVVTNSGDGSIFRVVGTNNTLRIANGSAVTVPILEDGSVANTCSALVEVDGGSTLRVGRADPGSTGYAGLMVGNYEGGSGHRLVVRGNSKLKSDTFCYIGTGDSATRFPRQCSMEIRDSSAEFYGALCVGGFGSSNSLVMVNSTLSCTNRGVSIGYKIATNNGAYSGSASLANRLEVENSTVNARILDVNGYLDAAGIDGPKAVVRVAGTNSTIKTSANSRAAKFYNAELVFEIDPEGFVQTLIDIPKVDIASNSVVKVVLPTKARRMLGGTKITLVKTEADQLAADETTTFEYSAEMCDLVKDAANGEIYITVKRAPGFIIVVR